MKTRIKAGVGPKSRPMTGPKTMPARGLKGRKPSSMAGGKKSSPMDFASFKDKMKTMQGKKK